MKYKQMGSSGLLLSNIALGTMIFGEESSRGTDTKTSVRIIHKYIAEGGNHIDTANVYVKGRSEEIVGKAIIEKRDQVILATKVRFPMSDQLNDQGLSRHHIINSVEDSLRRLKVDHIDLLYMHCWDPITPIEESLRAFDDLVAAGKVRYIGVSNFKAWQLMEALQISRSNQWLQFTAAQYQYSLVERNIENEISEVCTNEGMGIIPWGPLGGGFLTGKYKPGDKPDDGRLAMMPDDTEESWIRRSLEKNWMILELMDKLAKKYNAKHSQVAISWLLRQPGVCSVIIGARTEDQLSENLATAELNMDDQDYQDLTAISTPEKPYPYRFIEKYGMR